MAHFEFSSVVAALQEKVFDFITEPSNLPLIMPPDYRVTATGPVPLMKNGIILVPILTFATVSTVQEKKFLWMLIIFTITPILINCLITISLMKTAENFQTMNRFAEIFPAQLISTV